MGRKRKRAQQKEKKKTKKKAAVGGAWGTASVELASVEFASGHDGLLRGAPEPVILAGIYQIVDHAAELVGRGLIRLRPTGSFPVTLEIEAGSPLMKGRTRTKIDDMLVLLACALEADADRDIEALYADLSDGAAFRLWPADSVVPAPVAIAELALTSTPPLAPRVHVIRRGVDLRDDCPDDDFVGACAVAVAAARGVDHTFRLRFVSPDGLNDWTAVARLKVT